MKLLLIFLVGFIGCVVGQVDYSQCGWQHGTKKNMEYCPNGYVATGACASKSNKKCDGRSAFSLRCCKLTHAEGIGRYNCHTQGGAKGVDISCPSGQAMFGTCASLDWPTCNYNGKNMATSIECCDSVASLKISYTDCHWMYASKSGTHLTCPNQQVLTGRCGSESFANCQRGKMVSGIKCCKIFG